MLKESVDIPTEIPVREAIGKHGLMWPRTYSLDHPAAPMLDEWARNGCPTDCGPDWSQERIEAAIQRGPHPSAKLKEAAAHLHKETAAKVAAGHMKVLRWKDIKENIPKRMKVSPVALIPHKSRSY